MAFGLYREEIHPKYFTLLAGQNGFSKFQLCKMIIIITIPVNEGLVMLMLLKHF